MLNACSSVHSSGLKDCMQLNLGRNTSISTACFFTPAQCVNKLIS